MSLLQYSAGSGLPIYGGKVVGPFAAGTDVGTINGSYLWTPGRTGDTVNLASVRSLPLNVWHMVAGTSMTDLRNVIQADGYLYTRDETSGGQQPRKSFSAWTSAADNGVSMLIALTGGHGDGTMNGAIRFHCPTMKWGKLSEPSRPDTPGSEWSASYRSNNGGTSTNYSGDGQAKGEYDNPSSAYWADTDGVYNDRLPDGAPCARHTYNGVWYDSLRGQLGSGRISKWTLDLVSRLWNRQRWTISGGPITRFSQNQHIYHHPGRDALYGHFRTVIGAVGGFHKCVMPGANITPITSTGFTGIAVNSVQLDQDRVLFFWHTIVSTVRTEMAAIFNMAEEKWYRWSGSTWEQQAPGVSLSVPITNSIPFFNSSQDLGTGQAVVHIPSWGSAGQVIRSQTDGRDGFWVYDIATHTNFPYTPLGTLPVANLPFGKWRSIKPLGIALAVNDNEGYPAASPAIHVMRYA